MVDDVDIDDYVADVGFDLRLHLVVVDDVDGIRLVVFRKMKLNDSSNLVRTARSSLVLRGPRPRSAPYPVVLDSAEKLWTLNLLVQ